MGWSWIKTAAQGKLDNGTGERGRKGGDAPECEKENHAKAVGEMTVLGQLLSAEPSAPAQHAMGVHHA